MILMSYRYRLLQRGGILNTLLLLSGFLIFSQVVSANRSEHVSVNSNELIIEKIDSLNNLSRDLAFVDPLKALELAQEAKNRAGNYDRGLAYAYRNIASIYILNEVYCLGAQYLREAESTFDAINDSAGLADIYISWGFMYRGQKQIVNEIECFEKALEIYKPLNSSARLGVATLDLAESYYNNKEYERSREMVKKSISQNIVAGQHQVLMVCYKLMGELEIVDENYIEAEKHFNKVLTISKELGINAHKQAALQAMIYLADIKGKQNEDNSQLNYLNEAFMYAEENNLTPYLTEINKRLVFYYINKKNLEKVKSSLNQFYDKQDRLREMIKSEETELFNKLVYTSGLENENKYLEKTNMLQKKNIAIRNILLTVIIFFGGFLLFERTKLKSANKRIQRQNLQLHARSINITNKRKELKSLLENRNLLFSIIAHDLRAPFHNMLITIELLLKNVEQKKYDRIGKHIERIQRTTKSSHDLLEKLLLWGRTQTGNTQLNANSLVLHAMANEAIAGVRPQALAKSITIINNIGEGIRVMADKDMLQTIFRNLLQNAIKFSQESSEVELDARINPGMVQINVSDSGNGIDSNVVEKLFTINKEKVRAGTNGELGSGLGLVLCKEFVEKNGGSISVVSTKGIGTTVTFSLPNV